MYEKRELSFAQGVLWGTIIANGVHIVVRSLTADVDVEALQRYNQQLVTEVAEEVGETPGDLIVEDGDVFTFTISDGSACEGTYTVSNDVAAVAGEITCSNNITLDSGEN